MNRKIDTIKQLYKKQRALFYVRRTITDLTNSYRNELTTLISPLYWDFSYKLTEIENVTGIPYNKLHLYAGSKKMQYRCKICRKECVGIFETRGNYERDHTCSARCNYEWLDREFD